MLRALDWPTLEARREAARLTTLYKIDSSDVKIKSANLQPAPSRSRRTHDKQFTGQFQYRAERAKMTKFQTYYFVIKLYFP